MRGCEAAERARGRLGGAAGAAGGRGLWEHTAKAKPGDPCQRHAHATGTLVLTSNVVVSVDRKLCTMECKLANKATTTFGVRAGTFARANRAKSLARLSMGYPGQKPSISDKELGCLPATKVLWHHARRSKQGDDQGQSKKKRSAAY